MAFRGPWSCLALALLLALSPGAPLGGARAEQSTQSVFERFADCVVKIRMAEAQSGSKSSIGSGFAVGDAGHIVTNYHVISELVKYPERYRAELVGGDGEAQPLELLAIDVFNDLAVLRAPQPLSGHFSLGERELHKGVRIFSLGNPYDIGMSIVVGTYNGPLEHSRQERIHFTGALNPGMSGGPAVLEDGSVVGVNVATAGNAVSFLVPSGALRTLLERVSAPDFTPPADFGAELRGQLFAYQQEYVDDLLSRPVRTVRLGAYEAPTEPSPHFNCWGDREIDDDDLYETLSHQCSTNDSVHVSGEHDLSTLELVHHELRSKRLSAARFYRLLSDSFEGNRSELSDSEEDFTPFRCQTGFVEHAGLTFKTAFCLRRYQELAGLYDAVFKAAAIGRRDEGLETALVLSAVSFENAEKLARRHLEAIAWRE
jgi:hypothetical protein